jgi:hypothetical protein
MTDWREQAGGRATVRKIYRKAATNAKEKFSPQKGTKGTNEKCI